MNLSELLKEGEEMLSSAEIPDSGFDAMELLLSVFSLDRTSFYVKKQDSADKSRADEYFSLIKRRIGKEPLQYLTGEWDFYKSTFEVGRGVLIPRPETEELADYTIDKIKKNGCKTVYDLCSGSGCIGISIAKECPQVNCYLFEYMDDALEYTKRNAEKSGLSNIKVIRCDVLKGLTDSDIPKPDMIVSNPPYIKTSELASLQAEVHKEPVTALDGGEDGLCFYRAIADKWLPLLNSEGGAAVECGEEQSGLIAELFSETMKTEIFSDIYGCNRFVAGFRI